MNSPATARNGNLVSAGGMTLAIVATAVLILAEAADRRRHQRRRSGRSSSSASSSAAASGLYTARTVKMTAMPQLVSLFNAVGGGAAALIAIDDYLRLAGSATPSASTTNIFIVLDIIIGSITFTGSLIASGKLQGLIPGKPIIIPGGRLVTLGAGRGHGRRRRSSCSSTGTPNLRADARSSWPRR